VHIITQKRIWLAKAEYPEQAGALDAWYRIVKRNYFGNFGELRKTFPSVDKVGAAYIFNIAGNKLRLVAHIHFQPQRLYIREILTHKEYDVNKWSRWQ